ncbi:hypothetical protein EWM64_g7535 [Hericium alpestre]|uniref:Defective in cullin neddylation protein n=1 Tax=Hericium alpestre TaxID=135208 RepID=A0A4Y9ZSL4_9AGAM|nr:hypothetical protein EWM64_g7535 [Hericium alpestre]
MPPKRKCAENAETSPTTRTTRSSARLGKKSDDANAKASAKTSKKSVKADEDVEEVQPPKKAKTATKAAPAKSKVAKAETASESSDVATDMSKPEPYSAARAAKLFATYADEDDPSVIGPEGFERLCNDAKIPLDGAVPLILAWQLDSKEMAKITRDEWTKGMGALQISSLESLALCLNELHDMLILNKRPLSRPASIAPAQAGKKKKTTNASTEPYNRTRYHEYARNPKQSFTKAYMFSFQLAKAEGARVIDIETASALWSVMLVPRYPLMAEVLQFINETGNYKAANKDLWTMLDAKQMVEFCQTIQPDLGNYEADGAWPTMLDDFVSWKKAKNDSSPSASRAEA